MSTQNTTLRGLGYAFAGFAVFATHDALIKTLGGTYSVMQIIFFATLFSFVPMAVTILTDRTTGNFRPHHPWLVLLRSGLMVTAMSCAGKIGGMGITIYTPLSWPQRASPTRGRSSGVRSGTPWAISGGRVVWFAVQPCEEYFAESFA